MQWRIERETGVGWRGKRGSAYPVFTSVGTMQRLSAARRVAKELHAEAPLYAVRIVRVVETVVWTRQGTPRQRRGIDLAMTASALLNKMVVSGTSTFDTAIKEARAALCKWNAATVEEALTAIQRINAFNFDRGFPQGKQAYEIRDLLQRAFSDLHGHPWEPEL